LYKIHHHLPIWQVQSFPYLHHVLYVQFAATTAKAIDLFGLGLDIACTCFATRMVRSKDLVEVLEGESVVFKELFVVPVVFRNTDA
jgi:hypothetical protein